MCKCGKFSLEQLDKYVEITGIDENEMELRYTTADVGIIGSGKDSDVSFQ